MISAVLAIIAPFYKYVSVSLPFLIPITIILFSIIIGFLTEKIVVKRLEIFALKTKWKFDDILVASVRGMVTIWVVLAGFYLAMIQAPTSFKTAAFDTVQKVMLVVFIFTITMIVARIATDLLKYYADKTESVLPSASILPILIRFGVIMLGILITFQSLGMKITPILGALGIGGIAVALALQASLSNLFAGIHIIVSQKIKPGNFIRLNSGEEGLVQDITWRETTIKTIDDNIIIIPNDKLAAAIVTNYSLPEERMAVRITIGVAYDSNLEKVERITIKTAKAVMTEVTGGVPEFEPFVRFHTFDDFRISFTAVLYTKQFMAKYLIQHEFIKQLHAAYHENGIEIPFPVRTIINRS